MSTIKCSNCSSENFPTNNFCGECGTELEFAQSAKKDKRDVFILIAIITLFGNAIWWFLLNVMSEIYGYEIYDTMYYLSRLVEFASFGAMIFLGLAITKPSMRVLGIVFISVYMLIHLYWFISGLIDHFSYEDFDYDF